MISPLLDDLNLFELAAHYAQVLIRMTGLFIFLPIFGSNLLPLKVRFGVASVLAFAFMPLAPSVPVSPVDATSWVVLAIRELAAGLGLGMAAKMLFAGIETAAGLLAGQSGFAMANMIDPASGDQALSPTLFQNLLAMAMFLAANLHHLWIQGVVASYDLLPPAVALPSFAALDQVTSHLGMRLFVLAAELAAPALIVTFSFDLVMALVGRTMPQIPILIVGYPLKLAAGLVAMALLTTAVGTSLGWIGRTMSSDGAAIVAAFSGR